MIDLVSALVVLLCCTVALVLSLRALYRQRLLQRERQRYLGQMPALQPRSPAVPMLTAAVIIVVAQLAGATAAASVAARIVAAHDVQHGRCP